MGRARYLILENGQTFKGEAFGADGDVICEIVFTTGMSGYLETLTDKSFYGQCVVHTFPLIGNYGVIPADFESDQIGPSAYIVKHLCQGPSNFRSEGDLDAFLKSRGIVGLQGIDTRALTKLLRERGVMNGMITDDPKKADLEAIRSHQITDAVAQVSTKTVYTESCENPRFHVALLDFGTKEGIKRCLLERGCRLTVLPHNTSPEEILALKPDGIMLSNGPGDPTHNPEVIENLKVLMQSGIPIFGICLGHQLLALANGCRSVKMKYGHRGENQPARCADNGRVYITSQNHGYEILPESIDETVACMLYENVNDGTCEGIEYKNFPAFTVQFHPEASAGPRDTEFLFDRFAAMMEVPKCR